MALKSLIYLEEYFRPYKLHYISNNSVIVASFTASFTMLHRDARLSASANGRPNKLSPVGSETMTYSLYRFSLISTYRSCILPRRRHNQQTGGISGGVILDRGSCSLRIEPYSKLILSHDLCSVRGRRVSTISDAVLAYSRQCVIIRLYEPTPTLFL